MPRKKAEPKEKAAAAAVEAGAADSRKWDVQVHRIIEQGAVVTVLARSEEEAEEIVNTKFEDRAPKFLKSIAWVDGEIEQTESVVLVQAHNPRKKVKGEVVEAGDEEEESEEEE